MLPVGVCVALDHGERLVPGDSLDGGKVDVGLHQMRDRRVAQGVPLRSRLGQA